MTVPLTPTEERVLEACRSVHERVPWHGDVPFVAPLVWSLMPPEKRPSARAVLAHMRSLKRKGYLASRRPMEFELVE